MSPTGRPLLELPDPARVPDLGFEATIGAAIRHRARVDPDVELAVSLDGRMTYAQLERASAGLARRMLTSGIGKGTRVGLHFSYGFEWIACWLAAGRIGALVMPFSTIHTPRELGAALVLGDVQVLITAPRVAGRDNVAALREALPGLAATGTPELALAQAPYLRAIWMHGGDPAPWATAVDVLAADAPDDDLLAVAEASVGPSDLAVVVYTSGSAAEPKGVVHTHGSVLRSSVVLPPMVRNYAGERPPKILCGMPFFWVGGILVVSAALLAPITLLVMERFETGAALELIERESATYVSAWPTVLERLRADPSYPDRDLSSCPFLQGDSVDHALVDTHEPGVPMHRGMTETMGTFAGVQTRIVDPTTGGDAPPGRDGELWVRGYGVMAGYYGRERSEVFDADGWYHTSDTCFRVDGDSRIFYRGRFSDMIKTAGANVAPREVELVVEARDDVAHCFVVGIAQDGRGETVTAIVVPTDRARYVQADVTAHARDSLSAFKVPRRWIVADDEAVRWLGSGKPDKRALRALVESGALA